MKSPITGKKMMLKKERDTLIFRNEEFAFVNHFYYCEDSGEGFTTTKLDEINITQVYEQYDKKYAGRADFIPAPQVV